MTISAEQRELVISELERSLEADLLSRHGPVMTGKELFTALGYPSHEAFRQSLVRKSEVVPIFKMQHRKGSFALVKDIARHLAEQRYSHLFSNEETGGESCKS